MRDSLITNVKNSLLLHSFYILSISLLDSCVCIALHILLTNIQACWSNIAWAGCLGHIELAFMPWHFKSDDSYLLGGDVEGHCSRLCLHPHCLLLSLRCSSWGMDLAMHISGEFAKGLVVSSAIACIRLL